ncbi:MAG TPA: hypothetical protein VKU19_24750 [Bryobacteraceae bacterium]|nr:hypothetical protein [Bryobacteraceae bacterium]
MKSSLLIIALTSMPLWADSVICTNQNGILNGAYVVTLTGTAGSPVWNGNTGPVATMAKFVFDGVGNIQLPSSTIVGANPPLNVTPPFTLTGSYTVNRDCTGSLTLNFSPNPNGHYNFIISPDGRQITMISTDKGDVLIATGTRIYY